MRSWQKVALGFAVAGTVAACGTTGREEERAKEQVMAQIGLREICDDINSEIQELARDVSRQTEDRELRRRTIMWQLNTMQDCRRTLQLPDPRWALLELWTMLAQAKLYLTVGEGKDLLGPQQHLAVQAIESLLRRMSSRAGVILTPAQLKEVTAAAEEWAKANPMTGDGMYHSARPSPRDRDQMFGALMSVPAGIFSVGGGVKDTAQAVSEVAASADRGVEAVDSLPLNVRLQTELLLFHLEEDDTIQKLLADLAKVSNAIADVGATVQSLPDRLDATVAKTIREAESAQPEFQKTLVEGRGIVSEVRASVQDATTTIDTIGKEGWVERTTAHTAAAGDAWKGAFEQLNLLANPPRDPDAPPPEPSPPFDIKEAAATAEWATKAAQEVRGTVVEVRSIIDGEGLDERLKQIDSTTRTALDESTARISGLLDKATLRGVLLIAVFF
ncbi:MAG: hypothetical protein ACYTGV_18580, partial [Planctomycetota bacterium]